MNKIILQRLSLAVSDIVSMTLAFLASIWLTNFYHHELNSPWSNFFHVGVSKLLGLVIIGVFWYFEQYSKRKPFWEELLQTYRLILFFVIINLGIAFVLKKGSLKIMLVGFWVGFAILIPILRYLTKLFLLKINCWQRDVYILGSGKTALDAYRLFVRNRLMGYRLVAVVGEDASHLSVNAIDIPLISQEQFIKKIQAHALCDVIVALDNGHLNQHTRLINFLQHHCLAVLVLPDISGLALYGAQIEHFFGNDQLVLRLNNNLARKSNIFMKRVFDLLCVIPGIIVLLPVFIVIGLIIKISVGGRVFYFHQRIGKHGQPFYCIKFQSMYANSKQMLEQLLANDPAIREEWEKSFKLKNDPRITPIGRWLRKTSLDELPQLFNVLIGNMSLIGPRPIIKDEIARYRDGFYFYQLVTPGISGLWQVSGRSETDYSDRVRLDEWYVKNWSLWYDIVILVKTISVVLKRSGAY